MNNKEKIKNTFEHLHASPEIVTEVLKMADDKKKVFMKKRKYVPQVAAAITIMAVILGSGVTVYAMDLGGIQRTIQVWIHGEQTNVDLKIEENGSYRIDYTDQDGNEIHQEGGGVFEANGEERQLSEEEILENLNMPEIEYKDDGTVWMYYLENKVEITDEFEDGVCFVKSEMDGKTQYITVKFQNGYAMDEHKFVQPSEFN